MFLRRSGFLISAMLVLSVGAFSQDKTVSPGGRQVLWEPVDIPSRDLFRGPLAEGPQPVLKKATYLGKQPGGNNLKYRIKDGSGQEWVVKIADESQAEVAAVRLLWASPGPGEPDKAGRNCRCVKERRQEIRFFRGQIFGTACGRGVHGIDNQEHNG